MEGQGWECMDFCWPLISRAHCGLRAHQCWEFFSFPSNCLTWENPCFHRVLYDQRIHQCLQGWCWWPYSGTLPQKIPAEKSCLAPISIRSQDLFALVLVRFIFCTRTVLHVAEHCRGGVRADAALVGVVCHPALHSLGSTGRDKTACWSIMNVSGWWIHYNNITIGSARNTLYLNLPFSMVMHCVESSYFFFLLVLSDADKSGGEKSRSKIMILDSLVWVNCHCHETRGCVGCVWDTQRQRQKERQRKRERMWNRARVKGDGSKIIMKAFKSWGKVFVRLFRKLMQHTNLPVLPLQGLLAPTEGSKWEAFICSPEWVINLENDL